MIGENYGTAADICEENRRTGGILNFINKYKPSGKYDTLLERLVIYSGIGKENVEGLIEDVLQYSYNANGANNDWRESLANPIQTFAYVFQGVAGMRAAYGRSTLKNTNPEECNPFIRTDCDLYVDWWLTFAAAGGSYQKTCDYYKNNSEKIPGSVADLMGNIELAAQKAKKQAEKTAEEATRMAINGTRCV